MSAAIPSFLLACASSSSPHAPLPPASPELSAGEPLPAGLPPARGTLLIGDLHGTREIPAFVARVVRTLADTQPVVLALEIRRDQVPSLAAFLASDGGPSAREAMLRDPWWKAPFQDGRRSAAMLDLLDAVRRLRVAGKRVDVECFDAELTAAELGSPDGAARREARMASTVTALRARRADAALVVYAGNLHTMRKGVGWKPGYAWMAMQMASAGVALTSIAPKYAEGSAWVCMGPSPTDCSARFISGEPGQPGIHLEPSPDGNYDGWFHVGAITASPPAAFPTLAPTAAQLAALLEAPEARRARARRAHGAKQYARCADELGRIAPPTAEDAYNQACCLAQNGDTTAAIEKLRFALDHGFSDRAGAEADPDLAPLRSDPRWPLGTKP